MLNYFFFTFTTYYVLLDALSCVILETTTNSRRNSRKKIHRIAWRSKAGADFVMVLAVPCLPFFFPPFLVCLCARVCQWQEDWVSLIDTHLILISHLIPAHRQFVIPAIVSVRFRLFFLSRTILHPPVSYPSLPLHSGTSLTLTTPILSPVCHPACLSPLRLPPGSVVKHHSVTLVMWVRSADLRLRPLSFTCLPLLFFHSLYPYLTE